MPFELLVQCLGRFHLGCRDAPETQPRALPLPATLKAQSLLAYLVIHPGSHYTRDHLAGLFWGDRPEHNARRSLATALWQIRCCLPSGECIDSDVSAVAFNRDCACSLDVAAFERLLRTPDLGRVAALQQAVELYRGPFLDGFYDDWVLNERYRLESLYCEALARLMAARESAGEYAGALAVALRLLEQDPLREDAHRAAMRAYCRLGNRSAALAQYLRCEQVLRAELAAPPMAETLALRAAIVAGQFENHPASLNVAEAAPISVPRAPAYDPFDPAAQAPLAGREQELRLLRGAWEAALAGECALLLISGESGVGKTCLVREFANQLRWQGACVLEGHCYEFERMLPYQPLAEALAGLPRACIDAAAADLPGWVMAEVTRLAGGLGGQDRADPVVLSPARSGDKQGRLYEGVARFLAQTARQQPLLLVVENLHWASDSTLQLLHHLSHAAAGARFLMLGTFRLEDVDPAGALAALGRRLARDGIARRLVLNPLSPAVVATLVGRMSGSGELARPLAERLYEETEGNPFYLMQTIKALFEHGAIRLGDTAWVADYAELGRRRLPLPSSVSETIAARVARLTEDAQDAAAVAAVAGREFDFELLKQAWGRDEEPVLAALDAMLRCRLIVEGSGTAGADYAFTHHKIQEVVYAGLPRHRRCYLHKKVGLAMERWLRETGGARPVELAYHFEQALPLDSSLADKTIAYLLLAGREAERQSANQEAIAYYRRGLAVVGTLPDAAQRSHREAELLVALGVPTTVVCGYGSPAAREVYTRARDLCRQAGDIAPLFTSLVGLARGYGVGGDPLTGMEIANELLAVAETAGDADMLIEAYRQLGGSAFALGRPDEARGYCEAGLAIYDSAAHERLAYRFGHDPAVPFLGILSLTLWLLGYSDQAWDRVRRLAGLLPALSQPTSLAIAHCWLAKHACIRGDAAAALQHAEEAIRLTEVNALPTWTPLGVALRGWALADQGRAEGFLLMDEGIAAWRAEGFAHFAPFLMSKQAEVCLKTRKLDEAAAILATARRTTQNQGDFYWDAEVERLQGELSLLDEAGEGEAETHFLRAIDIARAQGATMLELRAATSLARLWQCRGRAKPARDSLSSICARFTEGLTAPDLVAARDLIAVLE